MKIAILVIAIFLIACTRHITPETAYQYGFVRATLTEEIQLEPLKWQHTYRTAEGKYLVYYTPEKRNYLVGACYQVDPRRAVRRY